MSKHVSFPAEHLSAYDLGKRIQIVTTEGAKITDTLTGISATVRDGKTRLLLTFRTVTYGPDSYVVNGAGAFLVNPEQYVRRIDS